MEPGSVEGGWWYEAGASRGGDSYLTFHFVDEFAMDEPHVPVSLAYKAGRTASSDLAPDGLGYG